MRVLLGLEFAIGVLAYAVCIVDDLRRLRWRNPVGRQLLAASTVLLVEGLAFLALIFGVPVPAWVFAIGFGAAAVVALSWVWLRWKSRREVEETGP